MKHCRCPLKSAHHHECPCVVEFRKFQEVGFRVATVHTSTSWYRHCLAAWTNSVNENLLLFRISAFGRYEFEELRLGSRRGGLRTHLHSLLFGESPQHLN
jgi:hypothetical protein